MASHVMLGAKTGKPPFFIFKMLERFVDTARCKQIHLQFIISVRTKDGKDYEPFE